MFNVLLMRSCSFDTEDCYLTLIFRGLFVYLFIYFAPCILSCDLSKMHYITLMIRVELEAVIHIRFLCS